MDKIDKENSDENPSEIIDRLSSADNLRELASKYPPPDDWFDLDMECPF